MTVEAGTVEDRTSEQGSGDPQQNAGGRRARTDVARALILAAVVSLLVVGGYNVYQAREFVSDEAAGLLIDLGAARGTRIERGIERLSTDAETLATDPDLGAAIQALSAAYQETEGGLTDQQLAELEAFYRDEVVSVQLPGSNEPLGAAVVPTSERSQYLQYWYIAANPEADRSMLADPGDGSPYSAAHAIYHPAVAQALERSPLGDVLLVDLNGDLVYTNAKRIDFATNVFTGPFADEALTQAISDLRSSAAGQVKLVDFSPYTPAGGELEFWVVTLIRKDDEVVGALATSVPNEVLTDLTTGGGAWEEDGLGETGEIYIVGPDRRLRSEARLWLEDPEAYLQAMEDAGYPPEVIEDVRTFGTTVLAQPADTEAVEAALGGEIFTGNTRNYLDRRTLSASGPLRPGGLGWVVVSEVERGQITRGFVSYLGTLLIAGLVIVIVVVAIAFGASARLLQPIGRIGAAASRVEEGDLDVELFDEGRDEFAYLSKQFNEFVAELRHVRGEAEATQEETSKLLASVVPRRLVDRILAGGRGITEALNNATLVAITLHGDFDDSEVDELAQQQSVLTAGAASIAREHGAEHLSSSASTVLYATGLDSEGRRIEDGVEFADAVNRWAQSALADRGFLLAPSFGIAAGDVITGVMGGER
nr:HAMP domain-containing protein [Acidimicrobiia bacterium]